MRQRQRGREREGEEERDRRPLIKMGITAPQLNLQTRHPCTVCELYHGLRGSWGGGGVRCGRTDDRRGGAMRCESNTHRTDD